MLGPHLCQVHNGQAARLQGEILTGTTAMGNLGRAHVTPQQG